MIIPDMRAIVFSFLIADLTISFFMVILAFLNRGRFRGLNAWVVAFLCQNTAVVLILLRGFVPGFLSMVLSNTLILVGMLAGLKGMNSYMQVKMNHFHNYLLIAVFVLIQYRFSITDPDLSLRTVNLAVAMILLSAQYIWLVFFRGNERTRKLALGIGIVYAGYAVVNIVRIVHFFTFQGTTNDYFQTDNFEKAVFISYQALFIFLAYSLAMMYTRGLIFDIATQEEKFSKAFELSPYAILITRFTDGKIIEVNRGFSRITGFAYDEAAGRTTSQLHLWIDDSDRKEFIRELSEGKVHELQKQFRIRSGEIITGLLSAELINVNGEQLIIASINDITPLINKETELREKVADLERFNRSMTGRELRMVELKEEINELCGKLGMEKRYMN